MRPHKPGHPPQVEGESRGIIRRLRAFFPQQPQNETIQRFEGMERVGSGCMGDVCRTFDKALQRQVALKVASREGGGRISIENEARALSKLHHPNVVRLLDSGVFGDGIYAGKPFLVLEFVEGDSLDRIIGREGALERNFTRHVLLGLCDAMAAVHEAGLVHRDIKPQNILIGREGPVLADFGVSESILGRFSIRNLTMTRFMPGEVEYAAPEIYSGKSGPRTDIFAAGMLMRRMRTGGPPPSMPAFLFDDSSARADAFALREAGLSDAEIAVVMRATERIPEKRYDSAAQMKADILLIAP